MAFESSLRARRSLIWETRDIYKYQKDSPVFSLMDANWILQVNPIYGTGRFSPTSYNIKLKNCNGILSLQPFEVVTFLVDRRNNTQMYCSKTTVSSSSEILFKASFDSTYEKLPGLKLYDDVAILCTFYPSTGLALSPQSVKGCSLRIKHSIVWKTGKPTMYESKESPMFNLKDSKWKLELQLTNSSQYRSSIYQINLRNSNGVQPFQPFDVEACLVDRKNFAQIWGSRLSVSSTSEVLYKASIDSIYEELPGLKFSSEITIVCAFGAPIGSSLNEKLENDFAVAMECSQCENQMTFIQDNTVRCFSSHSKSSLTAIYEYSDLSEDFGLLLDKSIMTDIELKCGEDVIPAHKAILAARSPIFSTMLKNEINENDSFTVEVQDTEPCVLRELLRYLYSGKISADLSEDILCKLYSASEKYSVHSLKKVVSSLMIKNLNTHNFIQFLIMADGDQELTDAIAGFIRERPELLMSDIWMRFSEKFPKLTNEIYRIHMMNALKISSLK